MKIINIKDIEHLKEYIKNSPASLYLSSQTSTVIPYHKIKDSLCTTQNIVNLSNLSPSLSLEKDCVRIRGNVNWAQLKEFLNSKNRMIKTSPTEELAQVLAGVATSCTGERSFAYGNLRNQVKEIKYINYKGEEITLSSNKKINFIEYQKSFQKYKGFKNAPFPRLEKETDLLIGTEGQLGIITEVLLETAPKEDLSYVFLLLPSWLEDYSIHMDFVNKVQTYRDKILSCELVDKSSWELLKEEDRINQNKDVIFLEIKTNHFESVYEDLLCSININPEEVFEIQESKYYQYRKSVPRAVAEYVNQKGIKKKGTDIQVSLEDFQKLLDIYKNEASKDIKFLLFGHFGDCHLHFNYLPSKEETCTVDNRLSKLYKEVSKLTASPFAEHGLGLLKEPFIRDFWGNLQYETFTKLKELHDPHHQFFPEGFLNWKVSSNK